MRLVFAAVALASVWAADAARAQAARGLCEHNPTYLSYCDGCKLDRRLTTRVGSTCLFRSSAGGRGRLIGYKLVVRPKLGQFGAASESTAAYRVGPRSGEDYFEYTVEYEEFGRKAHVTVRAFVTVRPAQ